MVNHHLKHCNRFETASIILTFQPLEQNSTEWQLFYLFVSEIGWEAAHPHHLAPLSGRTLTADPHNKVISADRPLLDHS